MAHKFHDIFACDSSRYVFGEIIEVLGHTVRFRVTGGGVVAVSASQCAGSFSELFHYAKGEDGKRITVRNTGPKM